MMRGALRGLPPSLQPPTCSRPHWNSSQHSLTRPTRTTRGPSFPPASAPARASIRLALPPARPDRWGAPCRRGRARLPFLSVTSHFLPPFRWAGSPSAPGRLSHSLPRTPLMGTPAHSLALCCSPCSTPRLTSACTYRAFPYSQHSSSQSPPTPFSERQPQILEVEASASPRGQPHSFLGGTSSQ